MKEITSLTTIVDYPRGDEQIPNNIQVKIEEQFGKGRLQFLLEALTKSDIQPDIPFRAGERLWKWRSNSTAVNQIEDIIKTLKDDPATLRAVITPLNPLYDSRNRLEPLYDLPIFGVIDFKNKEKLNLTAHLRHCDVYLWWLINAIQLSKLLELVTHRTNLPMGAITMFSSSAYVHEDKIEEITQLLKSSTSSKKKD